MVQTNKGFPRISIVIPVKEFNPYLDECLQACSELDYNDYEVIVLPDNDVDSGHPNVSVIPTGEVGPSVKRDIGVNVATGSIIAFIDDDICPEPSWLTSAVNSFNDRNIAAVGGPAVTPDSDTVLQKASGFVYSSRIGGGFVNYRYVPKKKRYVDDFPSCNLLVHRDDFMAVGGFGSCYWPGEDTEFCLKLVKDGKRKILYDPKVKVYHHRRRVFGPHLRQVFAYAIHRGYFVKRFPETSRKLIYFLPSALVAGIVASLVAGIAFPALRTPVAIGLAAYAAAAIIDGLYEDFSAAGTLAGFGIIATHLTYGVGFIKGMFSKNLREETKKS